MNHPLDENPILDTDSYKASHWMQYPPGVTSMYSYFESRGGRYRETVFFGLQYYLIEYLSRPVTRAHVDEAARFFAAHGEPFNRAGWERLVDRYGGRFPCGSVPSRRGPSCRPATSSSTSSSRRPTPRSSGSCRGSRRCSSASGIRRRSPRAPTTASASSSRRSRGRATTPSARSPSSCTTSARAACPAASPRASAGPRTS